MPTCLDLARAHAGDVKRSSIDDSFEFCLDLRLDFCVACQLRRPFRGHRIYGE